MNQQDQIHKVPFLLALTGEIDRLEYEAAIASSSLLRQGYDPVTQTSKFPMSAGTSLTYRETGSGFFQAEDAEQDDT